MLFLEMVFSKSYLHTLYTLQGLQKICQIKQIYFQNFTGLLNPTV